MAPLLGGLLVSISPTTAVLTSATILGCASVLLVMLDRVLRRSALSLVAEESYAEGTRRSEV